MQAGFSRKARRSRSAPMRTCSMPILERPLWRQASWRAAPMADALHISGLDCFYGETQVLYGLNLSLREGEVHCLLGRNGAGKTTALKAIIGLVPARSGS